jgi:F-type H+-transporting ATPase subunit a
MSATRRGFILFGILVVVTAVFCVWLPFFGLPRAGLGVGLPQITLKPEVLNSNFLGLGIPLTNSFTSMILIDIVVLLMGWVVSRAVTGQLPSRFVPRGFTNFMEVLVEFWYNQARNVLGEHTRRVLPLALSIFLFILTANWIKLIPGVETVGIMVCAEAGQPGYPTNGALLRVDGASLKDRAGTKVTEADLHACEQAHPNLVAPKLPGAAVSGEATGGGEEHTPSGTPPATKEGAQAVDTLVSQPGHSQGSKTAAQEKGNPDLFNIIPYFRPLSTDLNMTLALAIIVFIAVQIWGIQALGLPYFYKFINIPALGNLAKKPMGVMDFIVGLVDIISELSRLISLSFRLLGNLFAGGILLAVMTFLVAGVLPIIFYGLEVFVGAIQAYVFAILTVMYASQAVFAHHGDEEHEGEHEAAHAA